MRILMPFNKGATYASFYTEFHAGLLEGLRELGHEVLVFGHEDITGSAPAEQQALYRQLLAQPCEAVFDLCCWAQCLSHSRVWDGSSEGEPVFDSLEMDYVGLLFDHPWFQPVTAVRSARLFASVGDRSNIAQLALVYPELRLRGTVFAPPAVRPGSDHSARAAERDIPLLYIGNLPREALGRLWKDAPDAPLFHAVADLAIERPEAPLDTLLAEVLQGLGRPLDAAIALEVLRPVEYYRRATLRRNAVHAAAASGVPMWVVGNGWQDEGLPENVHLHPFVSYEELLDLAGRAQLALDASTYPQGANDRIFTYALNGALCFSNSRGHLGGVFAEGGVQFYGMRELPALGAALADAAASPARAAEQAAQARAITLAGHTWRHRVQAILDMLQEGR